MPPAARIRSTSTSTLLNGRPMKFNRVNLAKTRLIAKAVRFGVFLFASLGISIGHGFATTPFQKILIVVLENTNFDEAIEQPFLKVLADRGAVLTNYFAQTHPSQPNYIALVSGSAHEVDDLP